MTQSPSQLAEAARGRRIALVVAATGLGYILVQSLGERYDWPPKYIFLADLSAAAAFVWTMVAAFRIWRKRHM